MARPTLDNLRNVADFSTMFRWDVTFSPPTGIAGATSDELNIRCESAALPVHTFEEVAVSIRGQKIKRPGIMGYGGTIDLTFVETTDNKVHAFFRAWREAMWATNTGAQNATSLALQGTVILQRMDNQDKPIWKYTLIGAWPSAQTLPTMDGSTSDVVKPGVTISYDRHEDGAAG